MSWTRDDRWSAGIACFAFVSLGAPFCVLGHAALPSQFVDDAFYYFQIARHAVAGDGLTFDGVHATTGFHPLWLALLIPVFAALPGSDAALRAVGLLEAGLLATGAAILYRGLRTQTGQRAALLAALFSFALPGLRMALLSGLEMALAEVLLTVVWFYGFARPPEQSSHWWRLGGCLGLLVLARLETVVCVGVVLLREWRRLRLDAQALMGLLSPVCLAIGGAAALNLCRSGSVLPVSALVKHAWALDAGAFSAFGFAFPRLQLLPLAALSALFSIAVLLPSCAPGLHRRLSETGAGALLVAGAVVLTLDLLAVGRLERWYWALLVPGASLAAALAVAPWPRFCSLLSLAALAVAVARVPYGVWSARHARSQASIRLEAAEVLATQTTPDERIGAWNGGMLGYYSGRQVVMLDGLANDGAFYREVVLGRDLGGYLRRERISSLAVTGCRWPASTRSMQRTDSLALEFHVSRVLARDPGADPCEAFVLWRRTAPLEQRTSL